MAYNSRKKHNGILNKIGYKCGHCNQVQQIVNEDFLHAVEEEFDTFRRISELGNIAFICSNSSCRQLSLSSAADGESIGFMPSVDIPEAVSKKFKVLKESYTKELLDEFLISLSCKNFYSASMLARVIIAHIAIWESSDDFNPNNFQAAVDKLIELNVLGRNFNELLEKVKKLGNKTNHNYEEPIDISGSLLVRDVIFELITNMSDKPRNPKIIIENKQK